MQTIEKLVQLLVQKIPELVNGKLPVDVESLSVSISDTQVEITNDSGNPIPISGTVAANTGLTQPLTDTQLRASAVPVTSAGNSSYSSIGANATANIKNTAGVVYSLTCTNLNASTRYLLLFDSTGSTAGSPVGSYPVYGDSGFLEIGLNVLGLVGLSFSIGITFGFSTSATSYVAGSGSDCILGVRYA
jgi:hypothetical protein